jgi:hypothetical protein
VASVEGKAAAERVTLVDGTKLAPPMMVVAVEVKVATANAGAATTKQAMATKAANMFLFI